MTVRTGLCECGCGQPTKIAVKADKMYGDVKGQPRRFLVGHNSKLRPCAGRYKERGGKKEHVFIAEQAIGHALPARAEVHHVDGDTHNNRPGNLVVCQDHRYHMLLHVRAKVIRAGGDPNRDRYCSDCQSVKPFADFNRSNERGHAGYQFKCRSCQSIRFRAWRIVNRPVAA